MSVICDRLLTASIQTGLQLKPSKGAILQPEVKSLGYVVGQDSIATDQVKIQAVEELTISPSSPKTSMSCGHSWAW